MPFISLLHLVYKVFFFFWAHIQLRQLKTKPAAIRGLISKIALKGRFSGGPANHILSGMFLRDPVTFAEGGLVGHGRAGDGDPLLLLKTLECNLTSETLLMCV